MTEGVELHQLNPSKDGLKEQEYTGIIYRIDNDKDEKPWQRLPSTLIIIVLGVYLLLGYLTQLVEDDMPAVVMDAGLSKDLTSTFSEEAAMRYFDQILGDQPRVSGTPYHLQKTQDMKDLVDQLALQSHLPVRTDWQLITGNFWLNTSFPIVNYYQNLSNIVAVLEGESGFLSNGETGSSILVNCHYDSVPYALGASDNVVFCAVMAETLSRMSRRQQKFKHNIIFLFNGAEENPLQASHGFIQHPWFRGSTVVVNLDAAGMNGKPFVFQVSDTRVLDVYRRRTYRPNAQALGEYLFSSGIIPSDTDFRIWRDFGALNGMDIAFTKWGHVYHTRYDAPGMLQQGVVQDAGNMLINLLTEMADMDEFAVKATPKTYIFFDYLNAFMVSYSVAVSYAVDALVALFALLSVAYYVWLVGARWSTFQELLWVVAGRLTCVVCGVSVAALCTLLFTATTIQMRYLTQPWLVVPLFWLPYVVTAVCVAQMFDGWRVKKTGLNRCIRTLQSMAATRLSLAALLLLLTCVPAMAPVRYVLTVPLLIMAFFFIVSITVIRYLRLAAWMHLIMEVVFSLPAAMFLLTLALRLNAVMLPVMGRSSIDNPDHLVAVINIAFSILFTCSISGIELLFSRKRMWIPVGLISTLCIVLMFIPFEPFSDDGPSTQRHYWFHTEIATYDVNRRLVQSTAGVLVTKHDPYSTERVLPALSAQGYNFHYRTDFNEDCEKYVHCNLPLYRASFGRYLPDGLFLYTSGPAQFTPQPALVADKDCIGEVCTFNFTITPAPHNMVTFKPRAGVSLAGWSLSPPPQESFSHGGRPVYQVVHSIATYSDNVLPLIINMRFIVPLSLQSQPVVDVSHHAHKIHHPEAYTPHYAALIAAVPKYFNIATFMTFRSNYEF